MEVSNTSQWKALVKAKCPRCRRGDMFVPGKFWQKMYVTCPHCRLHFERHPGYFYVSMFVSYAMSVAEIVTVSIATFILSGGSENIWLYITVVLLSVFLLASFNFKYSRVIHMHFLDPGLKYEPKYDQ